MELYTSNIFVNFILFLSGFCILIRGSDVFVDAAADLARIWRVSELVIGLTLVSIGTSLPELASSLYAAATGETEFVFGNVAGSCITNITLILGAGIFLSGGMDFPVRVLSRDAVLMMICFALSALAVFFLPVSGPGELPARGMTRSFGFLLLVIAAVYCLYLVKNPGDAPAGEHAGGKNPSAWRCAALLVLSFAMILLGSKMLVDISIWGAAKLKVSMLVISSTIVAFGTSLPELAVTVAGVLKKKPSLAIGNIVGSNIFNILLIFGGCAAIRPLKLSTPAIHANTLMMLGCGILLCVFMATGKRLSRREGAALFLAYPLFVLYNVWSG